jgi:putative transposase
LAIRVACAVFSISEPSYRYEPMQDAENARLADWLMQLTDNLSNWGFGLCYLYTLSISFFNLAITC